MRVCAFAFIPPNLNFAVLSILLLYSCKNQATFRGKADMTFCGSPLSRSLSGVSGHRFLRRTCLLLTQSGHKRLKIAAVQPNP
jgi:hypothetical protein